MLIVDSKPYSNHPDDHYLSIKFVFNKEDKITPYVTYLHNNHHDCLCEGHYFDKFLDAVDDYEKRGK